MLNQKEIILVFMKMYSKLFLCNKALYISEKSFAVKSI